MRNAMLVQYNTLSSNGHQTEGACGERRDILETKTRVVLRTDTTFQSPVVVTIPLNYAIRFSQYSVGPDLTYQPSPLPSIKTYSPPATFPTLSLSFIPFHSLTFLHHPRLRPRQAPLTPLSAPLISTEPIRRG